MNNTTQPLTSASEWAERIQTEVGKAFFGKQEIISKILIALLSGSHVLLEDVPGTGKTVAAKAISAALGLRFSRIQCTPDLMPADILGLSIWSPQKEEFSWRSGPIFSNIVLVDEINRATPRTQSALLEAMAEQQVSIDGTIHALPAPFFLIATENPVEYEGTFPLPEAQKDRFLLSLSIGYPSVQAEALMLESQRRIEHPLVDIQAVSSMEEIQTLQSAIVSVHVDPSLRDYILRLAQASRDDTALSVGLSPRGSLALYRASQASAALAGRNWVSPLDIKELVPDVFRKRLILSPESQLKSINVDRISADILERVAQPDFRKGV